MKYWKYVLIMLFGLLAASCTEEVVSPNTEGEDDPIEIPPPPIPPGP